MAKKTKNKEKPRWTKLNHSFITRVSWLTAIATGLIFGVLTILIGIHSHHTLRQSAEETAFSQLDYINVEINSVLADVSNAVSNIAPLLERQLNSPAPDSTNLAYLLAHIVKNDRMVSACTLNLEANVMPGQEDYSLYAWEDASHRIKVNQIANDTFHYKCADWYVIPRLLDHDYWNNPYFSRFAKGIIIVTYSLPLHAADGRFIGVLCADVNVGYFTRYLKENSQHQHSYNIMIGEDASFIVHPDVSNVQSQTIFSLHSDDPDGTWIEIGRKMMAGHVGMAEVQDENGRCLVFYAPIRDVKWSAAIVYHYDDIFGATKAQTRLFLIAALLATLGLFFVVRIVVMRIANPVVRMAEAARRVAEGDFHAPLPEVTTQDELRNLCDSLQLMQNSLSAFMGQIQHNAAVQQRMDSEMDMARNLQLGMLPAFSEELLADPRFDLYAMLRPARMVGGDLYDYYRIDNRILFVVADVSGKGFPAALLMVETRSMFRSIAYTVSDPAQMLSYINTALLETSKASMFVTMFIGVLDLDTGHLTFSNAGHNPPLILHTDGTVSELDMEPNLPLGSIDNFDYVVQETNLQPGELIYLYTDGVTEAENLQQELYGVGNIIHILSLCTATDTRRTVEAIDNDMRDYVGTAPQADDITSLAIRYHHPQLAPKPYYNLLTLTTLDDLQQITTTLDELADKYHLPLELVMKLNLALEEVAANIILYSHPNDPIKHPFDISIRITGHEIDFTITDTGVPFDPTQAPEVDTNLPTEDRSIGGLGIHLTRQIMDYMAYVRLNKRNVLRLKKRF